MIGGLVVSPALLKESGQIVVGAGEIGIVLDGAAIALLGPLKIR